MKMKKIVFLAFGLAMHANSLAHPPEDIQTYPPLGESYSEPYISADYDEIRRTLFSIKKATSFSETIQILKNAVNLLRFQVKCDQEVAELCGSDTSSTRLLAQQIECVANEVDQFWVLAPDGRMSCNFTAAQTASIIRQLKDILRKIVRLGFLHSQEHEFTEPDEAWRNTLIRPVDTANEDLLPIPSDECPDQIKKAQFFS